MQVPLPAAHRVRVHLTHVPASILLVHVPDVQKPRTVIIVGQRHSGILGDDVMMNGQNGLSVHSNPCHLRIETGKRVNNIYILYIIITQSVLIKLKKALSQYK